MCYEYNKHKTINGIVENVKIEEERKMIREKMNIMEIGQRYFDNASGSKILKDKYKGYTLKLRENENLSLEDDSTIIKEFWKALTLAHECMIDENDNYQV